MLRPSITYCISICALSFSLKAQVEYSVQRLDINSGLGNNSVFSFFQDSTGFVWIGSTAGVQRYDMNSFLTFSDSTTDVTAIFQDDKKRTWLCGSRITLIDPAKQESKHIPILLDGKEMRFTKWPGIYQDNKLRLWLRCTFPESPRRTFLFLFNERTMKFELPDPSIIPKLDANILGVFDAPDKNLVLQTDRGLFYLDDKKKYYSAAQAGGPGFLRNHELSKSIHRVWSKNNNLFVSVWLAAAFFWIDKDMTVKARIKTEGEVRDFIIDDDNTIWLAGETLRRFNPEKGIDEFVKLPSDVKMINAIFQDREGNIWLATYRGILILDPHSRVIKKQNQSLNGGLSTDETMALLRTSDGIVIASTWTGGLFYYSDNLQPTQGLDLGSEEINKLRSAPIWSFKEDSKNDIWAGAQDGRIFRIERSKRKVQVISDVSLKSQTVRSVEEDYLGNLWFGGQRGQIVQWIRNQNRFRQIHSPASDSYEVTALRADSNFIWATFGPELLKIEASAGIITERFRTNDKRPPTLMGILNVSPDEILLNSSAGLITFAKQTKQFKVKFNTPAPVASVVSVNPEHYVMALSDGSIAEYKSGSLILLDKGNLYTNLNSALHLPNDQILIPEEVGLVIVKPQSAPKQIVSAPTITSIRVLGKELPVDSILTNGITLSPEENFMTVSYSALTFRDREKINYYSRIEDDLDFVSVGNQNSITFGRLAAGRYRLEIYCTTPYGGKSDVVGFDVRVRPPFWREAWFIMLANGFLLALIYGAYRLRQNRTKALIRIREKISRDLHDEMGSNLSTINILSNVAQGEFTKQAAGVKVSEMLQKISNLSANALESVDQIVWSLNPLHDSFEEVVARMRSLGSQILEDQGINFMFYLDGNPKSVALDIERKNDLFLIYKESINNISKYANCKNVYVSLSIAKGSLKLVIADDGVGFNTKASRNGNGLQNIKARSQNLKGSLKIKSELNKGTRLELIIAD